MLSGEAVRILAIETLRPTAAMSAGSGFPTLAGNNVLDSRSVAVQDLDPDREYTPILVLHTLEGGVSLRGEASTSDDVTADVVMDVIAELAVTARDEENGEVFADAVAVAETEPTARLVLMALCAQVRMLLERSQSGGLWRRLVKRVTKIEYQTFAVPNLGLRWQRVTMRYHIEIRDDDYDMDDGGLPEPIRSVHAALPDGNYAKAKLGELAAAFIGEPLPPFAGGEMSAENSSET